MKFGLKTLVLVLALPAAFLLVSADRLAPDRPPPPLLMGVSWAEAAPSLPAVDEGRFGRAGTPLDAVFEATPSSLRAALIEAGWIEVPTSVRGALAAGLRPMREYRLIGRRANMNWARPGPFFSGRRAFRLWFTGLVNRDGRAYWWGSGNARDLLLASLSRSRFVDSAALVALPQIPLEGIDDDGNNYRTDGRAALIILKRAIEPALPPAKPAAKP